MKTVGVFFRKKEKLKCIFLVSFIIYILILLRLTVFRFVTPYEERQLNLILFVDLIEVYNSSELFTFLWLFLGNIGWFVPFGFLLPIILKASGFLKVIIISFLFSLVIETVQFFSRRGVAELDDLILNTIGAAIGYLLFILVKRKTIIVGEL